jgi:DNA-directed RNA polymerase specialized sigma24 family protein
MDIDRDYILCSRFLAGGDDAYITIYRLYVQQMYNYGMNFSADKELIKDCIHDVFTRLYSNRASLGTTDNIKLYLFVALKNRIVDILRKQVEFCNLYDIE